MVTDGVMDALPEGAQEEKISRNFIPGDGYCQSDRICPRNLKSGVEKFRRDADG